jgi:hypothetical protein
MQLTCARCAKENTLSWITNGICIVCNPPPQKPPNNNTIPGYFTYDHCREMNLAFAHAMLDARKAGTERFTLGAIVDTSVIWPTAFPSEVMWSGCGSAAQMCADELGQFDDGQKVRTVGVGGGR